jgi:hypothetical protein
VDSDRRPGGENHGKSFLVQMLRFGDAAELDRRSEGYGRNWEDSTFDRPLLSASWQVCVDSLANCRCVSLMFNKSPEDFYLRSFTALGISEIEPELCKPKIENYQ